MVEALIEKVLLELSSWYQLSDVGFNTLVKLEPFNISWFKTLSATINYAKYLESVQIKGMQNLALFSRYHVPISSQ